jgi:hypothetical protein
MLLMEVHYFRHGDRVIGMEDEGDVVQFPAGVKESSPIKSAHADSGAYPTLHFYGFLDLCSLE